MRGRYFSLLVLATLAGCSASKDETSAQELVAAVEPKAPQNKFGFAEAVAGPDLFGEGAPPARSMAVSVAQEADAEPDPNKASMPPSQQDQIAYSYGFGFRISADKIAELQQAHVGSCQAMGPKCRILRTSKSNSEGEGYGEVKLEVAANEAGAFEKALTEPAKRLGGELVSSVRDGEDLSETIIDSEAKLQSRLVLREKLTAILRNNKGSVDELIKAEQAVADVNEQIDAVRSKLEQYKSRVRYSDVKIEYQPEFGQTQLGFSRPVGTALKSIGTTLGTTTAVLIYVITAMIPITLLILALRWVLHRFGLRIRFWRKSSNSAENAT